MLKGWSLMGDALGAFHRAGRRRRLPAQAALSLPGAFVAGLLAALGMAFVRSQTRLREDAVIGLVFTSFFAAGLLLVSINPTSVNVQSIVLGNILGISDEDAIQVVIISVVTLAVLLLKWKDLMVVFFDEGHARSVGLNPAWLKVLFFTLLSAAVVAALQTVGACLVIAMVVTPGATAYLLTDRFPRCWSIAVAIGTLTSFIGAYVSYFLDGATGGVIVTLQTLVFLAAFFFAPKHGVLAARRKSAAALDPEAIATGESAMSTLIDFVTVPLSYGFMQRALVVAVLVGAVCAVLSCYLVLKGWSLMGDAISHAVLPGIVIAFVLGLPLAVGAFAAGLGCAVATGYLKENSRVKEDTVMGIVFSGMFGFGLVLFTKVETDQHLNHILFGNMLGVTARDLVETGIVAGGTLLVVLVKRRDLLLYCFDPQHARAIGLPVRALHYGLLVLLVADHRRVAEGRRHHPGRGDAHRARRHRLPAQQPLRAHAGHCRRRRHRLERRRHPRELPHRRRDRPLHRADPDGGVPTGISLCSPLRPAAPRTCGVALSAPTEVLPGRLWSGRRESNPYIQLGKLTFYH